MALLFTLSPHHLVTLSSRTLACTGRSPHYSSHAAANRDVRRIPLQGRVMRTTHFALLVLCGAAGLILVPAGCASKKNSPPVAESQERELSRRTAMNVRTDASLPREGNGATSGADGAGADATQPVDTAHLLANRTASYSKQLDELISKRAAKTQAAAGATGAAADPTASAVQWEGTDPQARS